MSQEVQKLQELLVTLVTPMIDDPESIKVQAIEEEIIILQVCVAADDMGKVIGKKGVRIQALRQIMKAYANQMGCKVNVEVKDDLN